MSSNFLTIPSPRIANEIKSYLGDGPLSAFPADFTPDGVAERKKQLGIVEEEAARFRAYVANSILEKGRTGFGTSPMQYSDAAINTVVAELVALGWKSEYRAMDGGRMEFYVVPPSKPTEEKD
jgi:hypothetical protein